MTTQSRNHSKLQRRLTLESTSKLKQNNSKYNWPEVSLFTHWCQLGWWWNAWDPNEKLSAHNIRKATKLTYNAPIFKMIIWILNIYTYKWRETTESIVEKTKVVSSAFSSCNFGVMRLPLGITSAVTKPHSFRATDFDPRHYFSGSPPRQSSPPRLQSEMREETTDLNTITNSRSSYDKS